MRPSIDKYCITNKSKRYSFSQFEEKERSKYLAQAFLKLSLWNYTIFDTQFEQARCIVVVVV